jgi:putative transcriptional regulator
MVSHSELLQGTVDALQDSDFEVYYNEGLRRYFDLIGVREFKLFVKVLVNIDNLGAREGSELGKFAEAFDSQSFVVGERAGIQSLENDVVYNRFANPCVNLFTLRKILRGDSVSRFTKRGQLLVSIDGDTLRKMREERGLSREDMAKILQCTGQTVYRIENQNRIKEDLYEKLIDFFKEDIHMDVVKLRDTHDTAEVRISDPVKREIIREYLRLKLNTIAFDTPVDFAVDERPVLTPVSKTEAELRAKQRVAKNLEDVLGCGVVHVTKERKKRRLPYICLDELRDIESKEEILDRSE